MNALFNHLLSIVLLTPIAGTLVILLVPRERTTVVHGVAAASTGAAFLLSLPLWFRYEAHGKTWQFAERWEWMPSGVTSYYVGIDGVSLLLILLTTFIGFTATAISGNGGKDRAKAFHAAMLLLQAGMFGAFIALDFLLFFVCWQLMLAAMYFLLRSGAGTPGRSRANFLAYSATSSAAILTGILILGFSSKAATGAYSFDVTQFHVLELPFDVQVWVFLAFLAGFAGAVPFVPFHRWLPDAHSHAPAGAGLMVAAVGLNMGVYGFIRFNVPILPDASQYFVPLIAGLAMSSIIYGALRACVQTDWKRLMAYASISQLGMVMLAVFSLSPTSTTGAAVLLINRSVCMGALFLLATIVFAPKGPQPSEYAGLQRARPVLTGMLLLVVLATAALPALSGSGGMLLTLKGVHAVSRWWTAVVATGMILGLVYASRLYNRTVTASRATPDGVGSNDLTAHHAIVLVSVVILALWVALHPAPLIRRIETSVNRMVVRVKPAYGAVLAQGSDCPTPAPRDPAGPPSMFVLTESCADGSDAAPRPPEKPAAPR
jgi:NADH-quinone oxidoreductase subunit M